MPKNREMVEKLFKVTLSAPERKPSRRSTNIVIQREEVIPPWLMEDEPQTQAESTSEAEIETALWQERDYPTLTHIRLKATSYQLGVNIFFGLPVKRRGK